MKKEQFAHMEVICIQNKASWQRVKKDRLNNSVIKDTLVIVANTTWRKLKGPEEDCQVSYQKKTVLYG